MEYKNLRWLFPEDVRQRVHEAPTTSKGHPLARLLTYVDCLDKGVSTDMTVGYTVAKTEQAIGHIRKHPEFASWLAAKARACGDVSEYANASGALAEVRAFGTMLGADLPVVPVGTERNVKTPDFHANLNGTDYYFEVTCKQMNGAAAAMLEEFNKLPPLPPDPSGVAMRWVKISPHGGKETETTMENVAQKLAQVKSSSQQARSGAQNLLWLDLEDEDMWPATADQASPITTAHQRFYGGSFWYAFYGQRGLPLLEHHHLHEEAEGTPGIQVMRFDGRFRQKDNTYDGVVVSLPEHLVVFDNPWRTPPFGGLAVHFIKMLRFAYQHSWLDWPCEGTLHDRISASIRSIEVIASGCSGSSWPDTFRLAGFDLEDD